MIFCIDFSCIHEYFIKTTFSLLVNENAPRRRNIKFNLTSYSCLCFSHLTTQNLPIYLNVLLTIGVLFITYLLLRCLILFDVWWRHEQYILYYVQSFLYITIIELLLVWLIATAAALHHPEKKQLFCRQI